MKKINFLALLLCVCPMMMFGQLEVFPNGRTTVGVALPSSTSQLLVWANNNITDATKIAVRGFSSATTGHTNQTVVGIEGAVSGGMGNEGPKIGVRGFSGSGPGGRHYGVYGDLGGGMSGAAIFGTVWEPSGNNGAITLPGAYAGYFKGQVAITGLLTVGGTTYTSDYRYKQNITELGNQRRTAGNIFQLNPVEYNFRQRYFEAVDSLGNLIKVARYDEKSQLFQKKHYGLIAQEVQRIYPDLVYEDGDGYLSVDYVGIIPLLIQALKEQNARIEQLEKGNTAVFGARSVQNADFFSAQSDQPAALYQNAPNPFSQSTEIKYYLPASVNTAFLLIYDMNGRQLKQIPLTQRGEGSQIISGTEFSAGIYLYALIADGKEIDVKRMILTE